MATPTPQNSDAKEAKIFDGFWMRFLPIVLV